MRPSAPSSATRRAPAARPGRHPRRPSPPTPCCAAAPSAPSTPSSPSSARSPMRDGRIVYAGGTRGVRRFIGKGTKVQRPARPDRDARALRRAHPRAPGRRAARDLQPPVRGAHRRAVPGAHPGVPRRGRRRGAGEFLQVVNWYRQAMLPGGHRRHEGDARRARNAAADRRRLQRRPLHAGQQQGRSRSPASPPPRPTRRAGASTATPRGEPTGILEDSAAQLVHDKIPPPTAKDDQDALAAALKEPRRGRRHRRRRPAAVGRRRSTPTRRCTARAG